MNKTISLHVDGFWAHLRHVSGSLYRDQHSSEWTLSDGYFHSSGGSFKLKDPRPKPAATNHDYFLQMREQLMFRAWDRTMYSKVA